MGGEGERQGARQGRSPSGRTALLETLKRVLEFRDAVRASFAAVAFRRAILDGLLRKKFKGTKRGVGDAEIASGQ